MERSKRLSFTWMRQSQFVFILFSQCCSCENFFGRAFWRRRTSRARHLLCTTRANIRAPTTLEFWPQRKWALLCYVYNCVHMYTFSHSQIKIWMKMKKHVRSGKSEISLPPFAFLILFYSCLLLLILLHPFSATPSFSPSFRYSRTVGAFARSPLQGSCIRGQKQTHLCKPVT